MQPTRRHNRSSFRWVLAAAVAGPAVGLFAPAALAQYPVNNGGARDANNRVGSGGRADGPGRGSPGVTPNQIVTGNVTNFKSFRGPIAAPDARAFRGATADIGVDRFVRDSTGGYDRAPLAQSYEARPFYGQSRAVAPPPGYIPPTRTTANPWPQSSALSSVYSGANLPGLNTGEGLIPRLGTTSSILSAPVAGQQMPGTPGGPSSYLVMSPLGGIRQVPIDQQGNDIGDYYLLRGQMVPGTAGDRFRSDNQLIGQIRDELTGNAGGPANAGAGANGQLPNGQQPQGQQPVGQQPLDRRLNAPPEAVGTSSVGGAQIQAPTAAGARPLNAATGTGQSLRRQLATPSEQMEQFSELERRFRQAQQGNRPLTDQQAQQQLRETRPVNPNMRNPLAPRTPGQPMPAPGTPGAPAIPGGPTNPAAPGVPSGPAGTGGAAAPGTPSADPGATRPDPLVIKSLATGVKARTLAQVLTKAEELMRQGKYAAALEQYGVAEQAAPNNPLITLGRANAELGAANYRSAEQNLRRAIGAESALLGGKYDLRSMVGSDRLNTVTSDLKDLAAKEPTETMAPMLLAYISYNAGSESDAANYLNQVEQRAGAADPLVKQMRQFWGLPASAPAAPNK